MRMAYKFGGARLPNGLKGFAENFVCWNQALGWDARCRAVVPTVATAKDTYDMASGLARRRGGDIWVMSRQVSGSAACNRADR
jgi:hypothetical protein